MMSRVQSSHDNRRDSRQYADSDGGRRNGGDTDSLAELVRLDTSIKSVEVG